MTTIKQILMTFVAALAAVFMISRLASAEFIYDIEGVFAPALNNPVSASFVGELNFPEDDVSELSGWVELTNEPDVPREFVATMAFNLPNYRLYSGMYGEEPMTMVLLDYGEEAGMSFLASELDGGGLWDGWMMSFSDYPVGSIDGMDAHVVNEPAGLALLAIGGVFVVGMIRQMNKEH